MRNAAPFKRRRVALTALIDVVFLLLLFFMLTSTFSTFGELELTRATGNQGQSEETVTRIFLQLGADRLTLNGAVTTFGELNGALEGDLLLVNLDEDVTAQRLVDLLAVLRGRPDLNILVLE